MPEVSREGGGGVDFSIIIIKKKIESVIPIIVMVSKNTKIISTINNRARTLYLTFRKNFKFSCLYLEFVVVNVKFSNEVTMGN